MTTAQPSFEEEEEEEEEKGLTGCHFQTISC